MEAATNPNIPFWWLGKVATQTVLGATRLALERNLSPNELQKMVVTPGGTIAAGPAVMEKEGIGKNLSVAVQAAAKLGNEMAEKNL